MTDASVRVPEVSPKHDGREVDCEVIVRDGVNYYKQRTNSHSHYLDIVSGIYTPQSGDHGYPYTMDYKSAISRGKIAGASIFSSNGHVEIAGAVDDAPVTPMGTIAIPAATGIQMSFVSTSIEDSPTGTGIRSIDISYLDDQLVVRAERIALNGTTPVLSTVSNNRFINTMVRARVAGSAGSTGRAVGNITASNGGTVYAQISATNVIQGSAYRMVPAGKIFVPHLIAASTVSTTADAYSFFHIVGWNGFYWEPSNAMGGQNAPIIILLEAGRVFSAGSVFGLEHTTNKASIVSASIIGHLENA